MSGNVSAPSLGDEPFVSVQRGKCCTAFKVLALMVLSHSEITEAAAGTRVGGMPAMRTGKHKFSPQGVKLGAIIANCSGGGNVSLPLEARNQPPP